MKYIYRRMLEEDVYRVHEIEKSVFQDPWPTDAFVRDIKDTEIAFPYILAVGNMIIGYSVCWYYVGELHIGNIAVKKEYQGQGYGKQGLQVLIAHLQAQYGCDKIFLDCSPENQTAINLYEGAGFINTGRIQGEAVIFELNLA